MTAHMSRVGAAPADHVSGFKPALELMPSWRQLGVGPRREFAGAVTKFVVLTGKATAIIPRLKTQLVVEVDRRAWRHT